MDTHMQLPLTWRSAATGRLRQRNASYFPKPPAATAAPQTAAVFPKTYAPHENIFRAGDAAEWIYEILDGVVALVHLPSNGRRQIVGFGFPGDLIGLAVRNHLLHDSEALSPVMVNRYRCSDAAQFSRRFPALNDRIDGMAGVLLSSFTTQVEILRMKSANARVAAFILSIMRRAPAAEHGFFRVDMRRSDIADYVGLTPESVCRVFHKMKQTGAVERSGVRLLRVNDAGKLLGITEEC